MRIIDKLDRIIGSDMTEDLLYLKGMLGGRDAYKGPLIAEIELTNYCNLNCIACWQYSPLVFGEGSKRGDRFLSYEKIKEIIDDLAILRVNTLKITGGEPLFHKDIIRIISYAESKGIHPMLITNGTLLTKTFIDNLADSGNSSLRLSIWAGTEDAYIKTHQGSPEGAFKKILDNIKYILSKDTIRLYLIFVISRYNFHDIDNMMNLSLSLGVKYVKFWMCDTNEQTKELLLDDEELKYLRSSIEKGILAYKERIRMDLPMLLESISSPGALSGHFTSSVLRKSCYMGWLYSRVNCDGNVTPCCYGGTNSIGNVFTRSMKDIWASEKYGDWRDMSILHQDIKSKDYNCNGNCPHWMINKKVESRIEIIRRLLHKYDPADSEMDYLKDQIIKTLNGGVYFDAEVFY